MDRIDARESPFLLSPNQKSVSHGDCAPCARNQNKSKQRGETKWGASMAVLAVDIVKGAIFECYYEDEVGNWSGEETIRIEEVERIPGCMSIRYTVLLPFQMIAPTRQMLADDFFKWAKRRVLQKTDPRAFRENSVYRHGGVTGPYFTVLSLHSDRITIRYNRTGNKVSMYLWELCRFECTLEDWRVA